MAVLEEEKELWMGNRLREIHRRCLGEKGYGGSQPSGGSSVPKVLATSLGIAPPKSVSWALIGILCFHSGHDWLYDYAPEESFRGTRQVFHGETGPVVKQVLTSKTLKSVMAFHHEILVVTLERPLRSAL